MTRVKVRARYAATALAVAVCIPVLASPAPRAAVCPFEALGTWRMTSATQPQPMLVTFAPDGWANVVSVRGAGRPEDFDTIAQVRYQLTPRREPKLLEFQTGRGNDLFPSGASSWEITSYTDDSFSSRRSDATNGEQFSWTRLQTHRYFLTFATRGSSATFVMWTTLDGQKPAYEALGSATRGGTTRFGRMPDDLVRAFVRDSKRPDETMMRIELSEAEYRRTHQVFEAWDALLAHDVLAATDADSQALGLLDAALQSVNRCGLRLRVAEGSAAPTAARQPGDLVRAIRKINDRRHVPDKLFPFRWKPPAVES